MAHDSALLSTSPMAEGYSILRNDANDWIVELLSCPGSRGTRALEEAEMINLHMTPKANYFWPWEDTSLGGLHKGVGPIPLHSGFHRNDDRLLRHTRSATPTKLIQAPPWAKN